MYHGVCTVHDPHCIVHDPHCREIISALEMCAISPNEEMDMVTQIKNEVTKMCTRNNVCTRIILGEKEEAKQARMCRLIYRAKQTAAIGQEMLVSNTFLFLWFCWHNGINN